MSLIFTVCSSFLFAQVTPFNQANITDLIYIYQSWVNYDTLNTTNDVINLRGGWDGFTNFCEKIFSNPSIVPGPSGKLYIYGYGDHKLTQDLSVGDACWMIARNPDGKYDLVPQCHHGFPCTLPVYTHVAPMLHVEAVPTFDWNFVGWMGQRMAVFYSSQADAGGNHYFALVKIGDLGDPFLEQLRLEPHDDRHYFIWAVSQDGIHWEYERADANTSDCLNFDAYLTDFSTDARPILYRECFQSDPVYTGSKSNEVFHHYALFYSDPGKQDVYGHSGDGYLYVVSGYMPSGAGIHSLVARIPFSLSSCIGRDLAKPVQIFRDDDPTGDSPYCPGTGRCENLTSCLPNICNPLIVLSDYPGCIPLPIEQSFRNGLFDEFIPGMAVPHDWLTLKDRSGNFYGSVVVYDSGQSFGTDRIAIRFTRDIRPPFRWTEERELNSCLIPYYIPSVRAGYSSCEAGGNNVGLYQPPYGPGYYDYYDVSTGAPKKLIAYFTQKKVMDSRTSCGNTSCTQESGGLLPATIELTSLFPLQEVQQVKVSKASGGRLSITWNTIPGTEGYEILEGTLGRYVSGQFERYGYPFNPDGYPGGTPCPETVKYDHYRKCPWKDSSNNCCTWRVYHAGATPWYECCNDTSCLGTSALPITSPPVEFYPETTGARYILVSSYCHRYDQEDYGLTSAGIERPAPMCGPTTCFPTASNHYCADDLSAMQSNIDCYHYYYQGYGQPYDYGLNHWLQLP